MLEKSCSEYYLDFEFDDSKIYYYVYEEFDNSIGMGKIFFFGI